MLNFNDLKIAFSSKSPSELRNAYLLFSTLKYPWLVKMAKVATSIALKIHFPLSWAVKPTLYKQFVGGETLKDCVPTINHLMRYGVWSTLDYSAEGKKTPAGIRATFEETLRSVENAKENPDISHAVFKPSTFVRDELLAKVSERSGELTIDELVEYREFKERFTALCRQACLLGVRILVDAEDYCFQEAIDRLTDKAMREFNKEKAIVFATLQMYRHDRMPYLRRILADAEEKGYYAGIKFVRGAYMEEERKRAAEKGYPDPICKDKQATDANFDEGVAFVVDHLDRMALFMGTHNEESNYKLARLMIKKGYRSNDPRVFFSQLLGMSDNISFNLSNENFNVTKYVPYARVRDALPYLIRRAEENTSVAGQTGRELRMLKTEMARRKQTKVG